ncbi:MAG: hypothetical protein L6R39_002567 [Caloplaca ligustica]|nr:MAG: hypothetical protein L6R39_002567 [Caloplaca ligustica]
MLLTTTIHFLTLASLALASPLNIRRQAGTETCKEVCNPSGTSCTIQCSVDAASGPTSASARDAPEQCKAYCKSYNNDYDTCLPNCQVIDGNVQVNAPGLIIPSSPAKDTAETVPSSATLDELLKKCQAACDPAGQNFGNCMETCDALKQVASEGGAAGGK